MMRALSTAEIEKQIVNYELHFDVVKDREVEWQFQPPAFIPPFVELIEKLDRIPSQTEYVNHYVTKNRDELQRAFAAKWRDASLREQKERALIARIERAYPSFVRDLYFLALLRENGLSVEYDPAQDVQGGVDLIVSRAQQKIQVHVFLDSPRSKQGRAKKDRRHGFAGRHMDVMLSRENCKRVGPFWLPTIEHVSQVKKSLEIFPR